MKLFFLKNKKGFVVLTFVLIVSATILSIVLGSLLRSLSILSRSSDSEKSLTAWSTVTACGEYAVGQLASSTDTVGWTYAGSYSLTVATNTCYIYAITDGVGGTKIINASSTVSSFTKKIKIEVATNTPSIVVNSWKEVADF